MAGRVVGTDGNGPGQWQTDARIIHSPAALAKIIDPSGYMVPPHIRLANQLVADTIRNGGGRLAIEWPVRHGKALHVDTPIATPDGWARIASLVEGDVVFADTGEPCRVVAVGEVQKDRPVFTVQTDDGDVIVADEEHEWRARLSWGRPRGGGVLPVVTTRDLARKRRQRAMIKRQGALVTAPASLPIDPYTLGVWLGDGATSGGSITCHPDDQEHVLGRITAGGFVTRRQRSRFGVGVLGLKAALRSCGVLGNKHVPLVYLRASIEQRLALLQGLVDTDGYVALDGQVEFCSTRRCLADAVRELVHSLGRKASLIEGVATLDGRVIGPKYRVMFYHAEAASLPRKRAKCRDVVKTPDRYVTATPAGVGDTVCIQVDSPSRLFLAGRSMLPTHNSELISKWTPVWFLSLFPEREVVIATYSQEFTENAFGAWTRDKMREPEVRHTNGGLVPKVDSPKAQWRLDGHKGGLLATGVGGKMTGFGADLLIVDDPFANREQANSETTREAVWDWFTAVPMTRLNDENATVIVVQARWHLDDMIGRLRSRMPDDWTFLTFEALCEHPDADPLGRGEGEALWPEKFPESFLVKQRELDSYSFRSLYQQHPVTKGGETFRSEWWQFYRDKPDVFDRVVISVDPSFKKGKRSDYAVVQAWGYKAPNAYLLSQRRGQWTFTQTLLEIRAMLKAFPGVAVLVEQAANGEAIVNVLKKRIPGVKPIPPKSSKMARMEAISPFVESGNVWLPEGAASTKVLLEEADQAPRGAHDDTLDAMTQALGYLFEGSSMPVRVLSPLTGGDVTLPPSAVTVLDDDVWLPDTRVSRAPRVSRFDEVLGRGSS